jgi:hypothetical protein
VWLDEAPLHSVQDPTHPSLVTSVTCWPSAAVLTMLTVWRSHRCWCARMRKRCRC